MVLQTSTDEAWTTMMSMQETAPGRSQVRASEVPTFDSIFRPKRNTWEGREYPDYCQCNPQPPRCRDGPAGPAGPAGSDGGTNLHLSAHENKSFIFFVFLQTTVYLDHLVHVEMIGLALFTATVIIINHFLLINIIATS